MTGTGNTVGAHNGLIFTNVPNKVLRPIRLPKKARVQHCQSNRVNFDLCGHLRSSSGIADRSVHRNYIKMLRNRYKTVITVQIHRIRNVESAEN